MEVFKMDSTENSTARVGGEHSSGLICDSVSPAPSALPEFTCMAPGRDALEDCLALCAQWARRPLSAQPLGTHPIRTCIHLISLLGLCS